MSQPMRLLDLFSGIGGFSLGLERSGAFKTVAFCEIEPFCRRVLAKHWPEVPQYDDIRTLTAARLAADGITVDAICGGFPCQDLSYAGKGAGLAGERSGLWREYARLIGEIRPRYVIVENVAALLSRGLGDVLADLAALGFDAEWHCIPASAVGAIHNRDRFWLVAYSNKKLRPRLEEGFKDKPALESVSRMGKGDFQRPPSLSLPLGRVYANPSGGSIRNDYGVSEAMDRIGSIGNAVYPPIPELIGRAIAQAEGMSA